MPRPRKETKSTSEFGFEQTFWKTADQLRGHMDAAEYKHVALGMLFLKNNSDAFKEQHAKLATEPGAAPEDRDKYLASRIRCEGRSRYLLAPKGLVAHPR